MSRYSDNAMSLVLISDGHDGAQDFENNSQNHFINRFPIDVDCQTFEYEVALTKMKFLNSIYNLPCGEIHNIRMISRDLIGGTEETNLELPPGYYTIKDIQLRINNEFKGFSMSVDSPSGKIVIVNEGEGAQSLKGSKIEFSNLLGKILGFEGDSDFIIQGGGKITAPNVFNVNQTNQLYVYCSMVTADHMIGGALTNLLCICPISTIEFNKCVIYEPVHLNFLPVKRQHFLYATIYIYDHCGKAVSFQTGSVEVHVKLRRATPFL